ncbi:substrate-binding domain-containing protein, partial [Streptomyces daliensis]|nr:substrate-binding domain-containing protein [Streptomyces daliensis]
SRRIAAAPPARVKSASAQGASVTPCAAMRRLLAERPDLDGVFVASDLMAQGALQTLLRAGVGLPHDVSVVGFDDSEAAVACEPPLTTVRQPVEEMAAELARLLLARISQPERERESAPGSRVFRPVLVERGSA